MALAELCISGRLGATVEALPHADPTTALFAESVGRLVVEVRPGDIDAFLATVGPAHRLGVVTADPVLRLPGVTPLSVADLVAAFHRFRSGSWSPGRPRSGPRTSSRVHP